MCWDWYWWNVRVPPSIVTSEAVTQTEKKYFQKCGSCDVVFELSGEESYAGHCRYCDRQICHMCVAYLWTPGANPKGMKYATLMSDETRLYKVCDDCENAKQ